ncbi:MAG: AAA family ATPase [Clostridiales bacterium]|jgi:predicted AAA+ superfamily ATPase|nr:AAA family ATPase [Clostridiales bacterium]
MEQNDFKHWITRDLEAELANSYAFTVKHIGYWVKGIWHIGKTALLEKFGKDHFRKTYLFDCSAKEQRTAFERELSAAVSVIGGTHFDKRYASSALKKCLPGFEDSPDELVIFDKIQDSVYLHNMARWIIRGLDAKVCLCGSFLGDILKWENVKYAAGDARIFKLHPVAYHEYVRSVKALEKYRSARDFATAISSPDESAPDAVLQDPKPYFAIFYDIGGFPQALTIASQDSKDLQDSQDPQGQQAPKALQALQADFLKEAIASRDSDLTAFIQTAMQKTQGDLSLKQWQTIMEYAIQVTISHEVLFYHNNMHVANLERDFPSIPLSKSEDLVSDLLRWMEGSGILELVPTIENINEPDYYAIRKYMFTSCQVLCKLAEVAASPVTGETLESVKAETLVLNELLSLKSSYKYDSLNCYCLDEADCFREVGFAISSMEGARVLIELRDWETLSNAKNASKEGEALSGASSCRQALLDGNADYLIKLGISDGTGNAADCAGFVKGNEFTLPMWHIDRLSVIIHLIDIACTNKMTLEQTYSRYTKGIDDEIIPKPPWQPDDFDDGEDI